ncbi:MDR family MFS transporter [Aspergillus clavatus NRRL 1]|uniref:MFS transporter, putative n=1 Tax=Aspergillus clavatus (strain ATCC 1007 / CBS 513.65 / DSM 816 / NCTC 3887 / NRRL 1 / QM 1276 / 107) TaxID=344612 RepID=A1CCD9_ASPCL|nr:MFS transporter, putative [Aspergillus clavatus NRRL 1]EAW12196.1 MFS transporter, putative [Aspergillus clavatus NRRL 1]
MADLKQDHHLPLEAFPPDKETCTMTTDTEALSNEAIAKDEPQYPERFKLIAIVISLNLAMFLVGLDNTIISSAIPKITDRFHALDDVGWYASAYLLTNCAFQLMWGKLFTFYIVKWIYLAALFLFELGSLICAVAPSSTALIVGRAIAGIGGGGLGNGSFLLIAYSVPPRQRPTLVGLTGAMYGLAAIVGPLLGGAFTDNPHLTWRWCFYINLPLGVFPALIITFCIASFTGGGEQAKVDMKEKLKQMDLPGTLFLLAGIICLLLALQWGGTKYEWNSGRIIALLVLAGIFFITFGTIQFFSGDLATVPGRIFSNRNIWGSSLFGSCVTASFFTMLYYIPIWLQAIKGASPMRSGVMNLPMVLSYVAFSLAGGALTSMIGYYVPFAYLTVILMAVGCGLLTTLNAASSSAAWIGYQFIFGAGVGCGLQTAFAAPQCVLPIADIPIGTAIVIFTENLTSAVMVSVAQNVFTNQLRANLVKFVPDADPRVILDGGATEIKHLVPSHLYDSVIFAYNKALNQTFYVGVALSCFGILGVLAMKWVSVKGKK